MHQSQDIIDAKWESRARSLRGIYRRIWLILPLAIIGPAAGAAAKQVWTGALPMPAPHLTAIGLAVISVAAIAGLIVLFYRNRLSPDLLVRPPSPNSRGAFAMRETLRAPQEMTAVLSALIAVMQGIAFAASDGDDLAKVISPPLAVFLGVVALLMAFAMRSPFGGQDELFSAMRARAIQIGFWTGLLAQLGLIAAAIAGADIFRFLPLAFALTAAAPCLAFVILTRDNAEEGQ